MKEIKFAVKNAKEARAIWNALYYGFQEMEKMAKYKDTWFKDEKECYEILLRTDFEGQAWEQWYKMFWEERRTKQ